MPAVTICDIDDPRLEIYRELKATNRTRWREEFIVEGEKLVRRLLNSPYPIRSLVLEPEWYEKLSPRIAPSIPVYVVERALVEKLVGFNFHRGALGCAGRLSNPALVDLIDWQKSRLFVLLLPEIHDPENLGVILRNSGAFGVDAVLLGNKCCDHLTRRVLRVSMGTVLKLTVRKSDDFATDLQWIAQQTGIELIAAVLDPEAEPLQQVPVPERLGLLLGSEGHGLEQEHVGSFARKVMIPMPGKIDSLNVAVASGIFLYHFSRHNTESRNI